MWRKSGNAIINYANWRSGPNYNLYSAWQRSHWGREINTSQTFCTIANKSKTFHYEKCVCLCVSVSIFWGQIALDCIKQVSYWHYSYMFHFIFNNKIKKIEFRFCGYTNENWAVTSISSFSHMYSTINSMSCNIKLIDKTIRTIK